MTSFDGLAVTFAIVIGLMLAETRVSSTHQARLLARGAIMPAGDVYGWMTVLYPLSFLAMGVEGLWRAHVAGPAAASATGAPNWFVAGALLFVGSKALKYWVVRSLGERWSFRVLIVPGEPLVGTGPYRYVTHPNYLAVIGELAATAMMMGAWVSGPLAVASFSAVLWARVRFEDRVLAEYAPPRRGES